MVKITTTRHATRKLLDIPSNRTDKYGKQSAKYSYTNRLEQIQNRISWCKPKWTFTFQAENSPGSKNIRR